MPRGIYDRSDQSKWKPNAGRFKKGEHRSPETEFKKGIHPDNVWVKGIGYTGERNFFSDPEWRRKQSESHRGKHNSPLTEFQRGNHYSPETEYKPLVPGGISSEDMKFRNSPEYREWRKRIYERDNYTCQRCEVRGSRLTAHHIKLFVTYPALRLDTDNGITYCRACHQYEHARLKIYGKLEDEFQADRRKVLLFRLDVLEKHNTPLLIRQRKTFQSYSINPLTLQRLPKRRSENQIIKEVQLSFLKEVMPSAVKQTLN